MERREFNERTGRNGAIMRQDTLRSSKHTAIEIPGRFSSSKHKAMQIPGRFSIKKQQKILTPGALRASNLLTILIPARFSAYNLLTILILGRFSASTLLTILILGIFLTLHPSTLHSQESLQRKASVAEGKKSFKILKQLPITSIKNQWRSGTCWAYGTLGFLESEILRKTGRQCDLCEMFVVNKDYADNAEHYVRMHGYSQISEGGSCDDVMEVIRRHGICPEDAMPAPGSLVGDSLANFTKFFPVFEQTVRRMVDKSAAAPAAHWRDTVQNVLDMHLGACPETFRADGVTYTPQEYARSLGIVPDDYVSLTSYTHHPFNDWCIIEALYKWRPKPSYNIPVWELMQVIDRAIDKGYTVGWGGDCTGGFTRSGLAELPDGEVPTQDARQEQWDDWRFTYDHVMLIYGKAEDTLGRQYYMVKNTWGKYGDYDGIWYMSRDYMAMNTTYIYLNRHALPGKLRKATKRMH